MVKAIGDGATGLALPSGSPSIGGLGELFSPDLYRGTGNMSLPIDLPPGINGVTPELSLTYSSGLGNGPLGMGFAMGYMMVHRSQSDGVPNYGPGDADRFQLTGADFLVPVGGGRYRPATEQQYWHIDRGPEAWVVTTQDGMRHELGSGPNSRISDPDDPSRVFKWLIDSITDPNGVKIDYRYLEDGAQRYLVAIDYAIFSVEFDYDGVRPDAFTTRRAGFAITTARRLRQIRVVSRRDGARRVMRRYDLDYAVDPLRAISLLSAIKLSGGEDAKYRELPVLTMKYSPLDLSVPTAPAATLFAQSATTDLPDLSDPNVSLIDLAGDGLPDIVATTPLGTLMWKNMGDAQWTAPQLIDDLPSQTALGDAKVQFADLSGNGTLDLLIQDGGAAGVLENNAGGAWRSFKPYPDALPFDLTDPELRLVDMNGDGRVDALRSTNDALEVYWNVGDAGWDLNPTRIPRIHDAAQFPDVFFSNPNIFLADMTGDGLIDIVEVRDGSVSYWPYLGQGRYGAREEMAQAPDLPTGFNIEDVNMTDIAGDGTSDLVLIGWNRLTVWLNLDGRRFGDPIHIEHKNDTRGAKPYLIDVLASGRKGLLFNKPAQGGAINRYGFKQIGQSHAPFLMTEIENGMGASTRMTYAPVETMRGPARRAGQDWRSFLPFPQQVLTELVVTDKFVSAVARTTFTYNEGHYSGADREFRGFSGVTEEESGDRATPRVRRRHRFHVGDDLTLTEAERRELPDAKRRLARALSGMPERMSLLAGTEGGGSLREQERTIYEWKLETVVNDPQNPVVAPLRRAVMTLEYALAGPARAELDEVLCHDDQGNPTLLQMSYGKFDSTFRADAVERSEIIYAAAAPLSDGWEPRAVAERKVMDDMGSLIRHTRHYYDGAAHQGLDLGEMTQGNLMRIEECLFDNDTIIAGLFPDVSLGELGFHRSQGSSGWWRNSVSFASDAMGRAVESRDPLGHTHTMEIDPTGLHVVKVTDPLGQTYTAEIDPTHEAVAAVENPSGVLQKQEYDALGRITAVWQRDEGDSYFCERAIRHDNAVLTAAKPQPAQVITLTPTKHMTFAEAAVFFDAGPTDLVEMRKSVQRYCGVGQEIERRASRETDSVGAPVVSLSGTKLLAARGQLGAAGSPRTSPGFDWNGSAEPTSTEPLFRFRYDYRNRTIETSEPNGKRRQTTVDPWYTEQRDIVLSRGLESRVRREKFCARGRLKHLDEDVAGLGASAAVVYSHTASGAVREITVAGDVQFRQETALNGLVLLNWNADAGTRAFLYDAAGNVVRSRDALGVEIANRYDALNRVVETWVVGQAEPMRRFFYDADPQDCNKAHMAGRLARVEDEVGSQSYEYDLRGTIRTLTRQTRDGRTMTLGYTHNQFGKLTQVHYPNGDTVDYAYNEGDLLSSVSGVVEEVQYSTEGQPVTLTYANGLKATRRFDGKLQLVEDRVETSLGQGHSTFSASYDSFGHLKEVGFERARIIDKQTFNYDSLLRLTEASGSMAQQIAYDARGNILRKSDLGTEEFEYGDPKGPSRLTRHPVQGGAVSMRYDAAGRVIEHDRLGLITYDAFGRPDRCEVPDGTLIEYEFGYGDALVARHVTEVNGRRVSTYTLGDIYEETDGQHVCAIMADGQLIARRVTDTRGRKQTITHHSDLQGSVYLMTDEEGNCLSEQGHDPWGMPSDPKTPSFFIGRAVEAELGIVLLGTRLYDPAVGRFLSPDDLVLNRPEGFSQGSQLLNPYAYGINNPVRFRDRSGRFVWIPVLVGVAVGAFLGYQTAKEHGTNPWVGALIGGFVGGVTGGYGGWAMLGAAGKAAAISGAMSVVSNQGQIGPYFWSSVSAGFLFGAVGHVIPDGVVAGKGAWVNTQNIAIEVGRNALLGGLQGAIHAHLTNGDVWDEFAKGALKGALIAGAKIGVAGVRYDALAGPDPQKHGFAMETYDRYQADHVKDRSNLASKIAKEKIPAVKTGLFRRGGLVPLLNGGRSMVFGSNVIMAPGEEYNVNVLAHELRHIHQIQLHEFGFAGFLSEYGRQYFSDAWDHAYEDSILNTTYEVHHHF